jgi:hypothetical protein
VSKLVDKNTSREKGYGIMKKILFSFLFTIFIFLVFSCNNITSPTDKPKLSNYFNSGCLNNSGAPFKSAPSENEELILETSGNTINTLHKNAIYNCCIKEIKCEMTQEGNTFIIKEKEVLEGSGCRCVCPYNITCKIINVPKGKWTVKVICESGEAITKDVVIN